MRIGINGAAALIMVSLLNGGCASMQETKPASGRHHFKQEVKVTAKLDYLLYVPEEVPTAGTKWPLMLFLHGAGERGDDLALVKRNGPPKLVAEGKDFPFIIASPQCPKDIAWSNPTQVIALNALVDELVATYPIDESRIYLTGLSMGGSGTWTLAAAYPQRFAAISPICGSGNRMDARYLTQVPIWVFHGAKDKVVPIGMSQEMVDALKKKGSDVKFTIYPDTGHNSWIEAYNNPALYEWFLQHKR